jgi:hypothetical protein
MAAMRQYLIAGPISVAVGVIANALTPGVFSSMGKLWCGRMPTIITAQVNLARRVAAGPPGRAVAYIARMVIAALALCILGAISLIVSIILSVNGESSGVALIASVVLFTSAIVVTGWTISGYMT